MATYYMELKPGITTKEIKAKLAAFEFLYGKAAIQLRGDVPTIFKNQILPAFVSFAEVTKIGRTQIRAEIPVEGEIVVDLAFLYTVHAHNKPELMFITVNGV